MAKKKLEKDERPEEVNPRTWDIDLSPARFDPVRKRRDFDIKLPAGYTTGGVGPSKDTVKEITSGTKKKTLVKTKK